MDSNVLNQTKRQQSPRILLALPDTEERQLQVIVDTLHSWGWGCLDLTLTRGHIPSSPPPSGAIVDCSPTAALVRRLRGMGLPIVRLGRLPHAKDAAIPAVLLDLRAAGSLAVEHFAERGFRQVAYEISVSRSAIEPFFASFESRAAELGLACEQLRLKTAPPPPAMTKESGQAYARREDIIGKWLRSLSTPVGVVSFSASVLCTICNSIGLDVPGEVALLGVGNHALPCELSPVPLSSIDINFHQQARQAARLLRRLIEQKPVSKSATMIQPLGVVTRRSTDVLAVGNPNVVEAMQFMWDNLHLDLSVDMVAAQVDMSSRSLQRLFKVHLGRGINAELRRRRIHELARLLRTTPIPVADLAPKVGFRTLVHMHKCFRETYGMTPRQYRNGKQGQAGHPVSRTKTDW